MQKRYFKENKKLLNFISKKENNILEIKVIKKSKINELKNIKNNFISSYCVIYEKSI